MTTKDRLTQALKEAGAPARMVELAQLGAYDDCLSTEATPIMNLVRDLNTAGLHDLKARAMRGEFDASREEWNAWKKKNLKRSKS